MDEPRRDTPAEHEEEQRESLLSDQRGAIMVMGVFMAVLLVGMIYYVSGIGETVLYRERMQDASDSGAFAAAVMHARGMNIIALLNMVMAAVLAVLVALKVLHDLIASALIIASGICAFCGPECGGCCAACPFVPILEVAREDVAAVIEEVEPPIQTIVSLAHSVSVGVREGMPIAAQAKVMETGAYTYDAPTTAGFMLPAYEPLPVEDDDSSLLCRKAGEQAARLLVPVIPGFPIARFISPATEALAATFSSRYCGEGRDKAQKIVDDAELGDETFQLRAFMLGDPPFRDTEEGVRVAAWGQDTSAGVYGALRDLGRVSFAQAEYYYDDRGSDRREWMWNMRWRARLRRFRAPEDMAGLGSVCSGSACGVLGRIGGLSDVVVH